MSVPAHRLAALQKLQCSIFNTVYNPTGVRQGTKVLRERLKGPAVASYYPRRVKWPAMLRTIVNDAIFYDPKEYDRLESLQFAKLRGKGAPTKKRTAADSKKFGKRK